ncbi:hypothetical protein GCM10010129_36980 [Streptomyces fumigatiscleroticus]|nr:hypothetical protein GCM10010129_36980 [Streptomyces fumigatiscleroticus]
MLSAAGGAGATLVWVTSKRARRYLGGGFEDEGTDFGRLFTELPLVALAGAVLPAVVWALFAYALSRRGRRRSDLHE